jgi:hypothetical protein
MDHPFFVDGNGQNINIFARISQFSQDIGWYRGGSLSHQIINNMNKAFHVSMKSLTFFIIYYLSITNRLLFF